MEIKLLFSQYFDVDSDILEKYGALDICLTSDLPLFIDPFLLFASEKEEYQTLHDNIINHIIYLKDIATSKNGSKKLQNFKFPEVKQNWLGWCEHGNKGRGLGKIFAEKLKSAFNGFYSNFGNETISEKSHIEKLTLVGKGIGKDFISDFTTNLILEYLLEFTQEFAMKYLQENQRKKIAVNCVFDKTFDIRTRREFTLPYFYREKNGDYIILTPFDILTKDEAFICSKDLYNSFSHITNSLENTDLRDNINEYFAKKLPREAKKRDTENAIYETLKKFPELLDYYIKIKEEKRDEAQAISKEKIQKLKEELINLKRLGNLLLESNFFNILPNSYNESLKRVHFLKHVIENNDGYRIFYHNGKPLAKEETIQRIFKLTWYHTPYDVNAEVNNGRGPADYKVSLGAEDCTIIEFKLGRSTSLKKNLENQTEIYKKASGAKNDIKVILCYIPEEIQKVEDIIKSVTGSEDIPENFIIIDASPKISASKV